MNNMKILQNNFTTPEQSKWLLELGVPKDSADCYLTRFGIDEDWEVKVLNNVKYSELAISNQEYCLPCWSVGQMIKILDISQEYCFQFNGDYDKWIPYNHCTTEDILTILSDKRNKFNFSKLED